MPKEMVRVFERDKKVDKPVELQLIAIDEEEKF